MKVFDKIILYGILFSFLSLLLYAFTKNFAVSFFVAFLGTVFLRSAFLLLYSHRKRKGKIDTKSMEDTLSILSPTEQKDLLLSTIPSRYILEEDTNYILLQKEERICLFLNYKFSPTSCDDLARFYRSIREKDVEKIVVLGRMPSRNVVVLSKSFPVPIIFLSPSRLKKYLTKHNALPKPLPVPPKRKPNPKEVFRDAFSPDRMKYYGGGALFFAFYAFFGVMKIWYSVFCGISLLCGFLCMYRWIKEQK